MWEKVYAEVALKDFKSVTKFDTYGSVVNVVVQNAFVLAGIISLLLLIFGGFRIIVGAGGGDTKSIEQGQKAMVGAAVGLLVVLGSFLIVQIIEYVSGVNILKL